MGWDTQCLRIDELKRKKELTGNEILEKLEENESDVSKAVRDMLEELCPFDINDDEVLKIEDRLERVDKVTKKLQARVGKLQKQMKERKFRHKPEMLDEKFVSCSQYSVLDSQGLDNFEMEKETEESKENRPGKYKKKPLDHDMCLFTGGGWLIREEHFFSGQKRRAYQ